MSWPNIPDLNFIGLGTMMTLGATLLFSDLQSTNASVVVLVVTTLAGFVTMFVQQIFAARASQREINRLAQQHEWERQDRAEKSETIRLQAEAEAKLLLLKTEAATAELKLLLEKRTREIRAAATENTADIKQMIGEATEKNRAEIIDVINQQNGGNGKP